MEVYHSRDVQSTQFNAPYRSIQFQSVLDCEFHGPILVVGLCVNFVILHA